jgi:hypothetical protein
MKLNSSGKVEIESKLSGNLVTLQHITERRFFSGIELKSHMLEQG